MANPRKFSEKIALQKQKQAEGTAEFERIMKEVYATKMDETQANQKLLECCLSGQESGASIPSPGTGNGTAGGGGGGGGGSGNGSGASGGASPDGIAGGGGGGGGSPTGYRESRVRSVGGGPMRRPSERKQDRSPYGSSSAGGGLVNALGLPNSVGGGSNNNNNNNGTQQNLYLSPPMDTSWRRSNSDSALHQVAATEGFATDMNALHANYPQQQQQQQQSHQQQQQHHQQHHQRSHSPHTLARTQSPQPQIRKPPLLPHQLQLQQLQQHQHNMQQQLLRIHQQQQPQAQQQQQQQQQLHQQQQQQQQQQLHLSQQQQQQATPYTAKLPHNSLFRPLLEQANSYANTGSLPNLTALQHYAAPQQQSQQQQQQLPLQQQQHQTLSPVMSPHNSRLERDQSPSPFSPGSGAAGPPSPYHQQQHSPTSAGGSSTQQQQQQQQQQPAQPPVNSSPHLSFSPLPTLGAGVNNSSSGTALSGNLTDYRQPANPSSPRSSPGLLSSVSGSELHTSAPASPIRVQQPAQSMSSAYDTSYGNLSFHNNFENFSLGDSNSSPEQQQHSFPSNFVPSLDFDNFTVGGATGTNGGSSSNGPYHNQEQTQNKLLDFNELSGSPEAGGNNNNLRRVNQQQQQQQQQQQLLNNNSNGAVAGVTHNGSLNGPTSQHQQHHNNNSSNGGGGGGGGGAGNGGGIGESLVASPVPSPLGGPSSPLPIPMSGHGSPQHQQLSLSLHHSPHHSPLHSPHHTNSPLSSSSPVSNACNSNMVMNHHHQQQQQQHQSHHHQQQQHHPHQQHHQAQSQSLTPTTASIPQIVFSDFSTTADFNREIFDSLDLDLGQMDVAGLQMLSDQNPIMIADPNIEDSFRRDLN